MSFELRGAGYRYPGGERDAIHDLEFTLEAGRHTAIVGPNGAGKTTLARLLLGLVRPDRGQVLLEGRPAVEWGRREMAKRVGVVAQNGTPAIPITVRDFVEMGRHPYLRPWSPLAAADRTVVAGALERAELRGLEGRLVWELSGGELQRTKLARAFAQAPDILLLDEPTAHLDLGHEMRIFRLVREFVDAGGSAITITHNLHLASRFAGRIVLLHDGEVAADGPPEAVLRPATLSRVFEWPLAVVAVDEPGATGLQVVPADRAPASRSS